ncbi:MAG: protein translocase subunit SecF [Sphingomonadales bacterium]
MFTLHLIPSGTNIEFTGRRKYTYFLSAILIVASLVLFFAKGLNFGIDFKGGILIEVGTTQPADLKAIRKTVGRLGLGDVAIQEFGAPTDVLIRIERQSGDADAQQAAVDQVKAALGADIADELSYRRVEVVGPKVSGELIRDGVLAITLAVFAVLLYIWFRFEWQFGVGAVAALVHDVTLTIGLFSLIGLEFNLSIIAAILTIVGYSLNDTVVVYDRVRENLRKYKRMELDELLNRSINETLARTAVTSLTTLLALGALFVFGGEVLRGFSAAMIWGVFVGTFSSIFIASPVLLQLDLRRSAEEGGEADAARV